MRTHGSLENLFRTPLTDAPDEAKGTTSTLNAMEHFSRTLRERAGLASSHLLPCPGKGSACKRLALYVRWMTRCDDVDPGGWSSVSQRDIIVPLDTHMFRIATALGFIKRKSADGKAALDATNGFRNLNPEDPVKYDFALTRFGIRPGLSVEELVGKLWIRGRKGLDNEQNN